VSAGNLANVEKLFGVPIAAFYGRSPKITYERIRHMRSIRQAHSENEVQLHESRARTLKASTWGVSSKADEMRPWPNPETMEVTRSTEATRSRNRCKTTQIFVQIHR
jgi:hypothetical protein